MKDNIREMINYIGNCGHIIYSIRSGHKNCYEEELLLVASNLKDVEDDLVKVQKRLCAMLNILEEMERR